MFRKKARSKSLAVPAPSKTVAGSSRSKSSPNFSFGRATKTKPIMKFVSADESLHKKYEETRCKRDASLQFNEIEIREYARTVGDNPSCSSGPPISISWDYNPATKTLSIDEYERQRPARRSHIEMVVPRTVREQMLRREWDIPQRLIAEAVRQNIKVKNQRRATVNNLDKADKVEEMMEVAGKKLMRGLLLKKSTAHQVAELERQWEQAEKVRKQAELIHQMKGEHDDDDDDDNGVENKRHLKQPVEIDPTFDDNGSPSEEENVKEVKKVVAVPKGTRSKASSGAVMTFKRPIIRAFEESDSEVQQTEGEATAQNGNHGNHLHKINAAQGDSQSDGFEC